MFTKLFVGSFLTLGLLLTGAVDGDDKAKDCCSAKLACCKEKSACCVADTRLGCCEKGMKCCAENKGCCAAVQKCCTEGMACCKEAKACCGPKKSVGKGADCCSTTVVETKASCCTTKISGGADKSACGLVEGKIGSGEKGMTCHAEGEVQKRNAEAVNSGDAPKACCGSPRKKS